jgi:hypothetical protein
MHPLYIQNSQEEVYTCWHFFEKKLWKTRILALFLKESYGKLRASISEAELSLSRRAGM